MMLFSPKQWTRFAPKRPGETLRGRGFSLSLSFFWGAFRSRRRQSVRRHSPLPPTGTKLLTLKAARHPKFYLFSLFAIALLFPNLAESKNCETFACNQGFCPNVTANPGQFEFGTIQEAILEMNPFAPDLPTHCILLVPDGANDLVIQESLDLPIQTPPEHPQPGEWFYKVRIEALQDATHTGKVIWMPAAGQGRTITMTSCENDITQCSGQAIASELYVEGVTFTGGRVPTVEGSVARVFRSKLTVVDSVFEDNVAGCGGAIAVFGKHDFFVGTIVTLEGIVDVTGSTFNSNYACQGGALYVAGGASANIANSVFNNNQAEAGGSIFVGAGISTNQWTSGVTVVDSTFTGGDTNIDDAPIPNASTHCQDAVDLDPNLPGLCNNFSGYAVNDLAAAELGGNGAAIQVHGTFSGNRLKLHGNTATGTGGAVYQMDYRGLTAFQLTNSFVVDNNAAGTPSGDGIYIDVPLSRNPDDTPPTGSTGARAIADALLWNVTIAGNGGEGLWIGSGILRDLKNLLLWKNGVDLVGPLASECDGCIIENVSPTNDPLFVGNGDYHLSTPQSPAKEAGTSAVLTPIPAIGTLDFTLDVDGDPRVTDALIDIGADEYTLPTATPTPTITPTPTVTSTVVPSATATPTPTSGAVPAQPEGDSAAGIMLLLGLMLVFVLTFRGKTQAKPSTQT